MFCIFILRSLEGERVKNSCIKSDNIEYLWILPSCSQLKSSFYAVQYTFFQKRHIKIL